MTVSSDGHVSQAADLLASARARRKSTKTIEKFFSVERLLIDSHLNEKEACLAHWPNL